MEKFAHIFKRSKDKKKINIHQSIDEENLQQIQEWLTSPETLDPLILEERNDEGNAPIHVSIFHFFFEINAINNFLACLHDWKRTNP